MIMDGENQNTVDMVLRPPCLLLEHYASVLGIVCLLAAT